MMFSAYPWNHWTRDDIVSSQDLQTLAHYCQGRAEHDQWGLVQQNQAPEDIAAIMAVYNECIAVISQELHKIIPAPRHQVGQTAICHLAIQPPGYDYPPHYEHPAKAWSFITYIWPEISTGTMLMRNEQRYEERETPWQQGRTLIFAGDTDVTWHAYRSGDQPRATLCGFMISGDDPTR